MPNSGARRLLEAVGLSKGVVCARGRVWRGYLVVSGGAWPWQPVAREGRFGGAPGKGGAFSVSHQSHQSHQRQISSDESDDSDDQISQLEATEPSDDQILQLEAT